MALMICSKADTCDVQECIHKVPHAYIQHDTLIPVDCDFECHGGTCVPVITETEIQYDVMNEEFDTPNDQVLFVEEILGYKVVFRVIWLTLLEPNHICAYVRLPLPFRSFYDIEYNYGYPNETYREGDILGVDTVHYFNRNQTMDQKLECARRQITDLIQGYIDWRVSGNDQDMDQIVKPNHVPMRVKRFLNLEL